MKLSFLLWLASIMPQPAADQVCLATTVYLEARSESKVGQMAVAEVAMRRRESGRWGKTVCDVVRAPGQFATTTTRDSRIMDDPEAWNTAWQIAGRSLAIWSLPRDRRKFVVPEADHFVLADSVSPGWIKGPPLATIGAHNFYRIN
ncbi:spore germination cell wall hydrolase CwlJ-like protein [Dokdonella fugitiva]|uniref:Spore germination cell wall hydrolase CwlJ-like protein n=1 Tax=Dokdonella fugitiva TaxID=328517 RepID=A0A839F1J6_9GAMM|nr:cell wall hydrolase [Dokdonella fugitiva]MBA8888843.1 spore germination cell wall hydrolase CwlJ-like protein [Dokdonella fugitiva]